MCVRRAGGSLPTQVVERLEPAGVDAGDGVVGEVQTVQVCHGVEQTLWETSLGKCVAVQQQSVPCSLRNSCETGEQVRRKRCQLVVGQVKPAERDTLEQARGDRFKVVAAEVEVRRVRQVGEVISIQCRQTV